MEIQGRCGGERRLRTVLKPIRAAIRRQGPKKIRKQLSQHIRSPAELPNPFPNIGTRVEVTGSNGVRMITCARPSKHAAVEDEHSAKVAFARVKKHGLPIVRMLRRLRVQNPQEQVAAAPRGRQGRVSRQGREPALRGHFTLPRAVARAGPLREVLLPAARWRTASRSRYACSPTGFPPIKCAATSSDCTSPRWLTPWWKSCAA